MIEKDELVSLIPHKGKMLLLSRVIEYNLKERNLYAEYHITGDCLFYDPAIDGVPAWVGFEFMAQAISVLSGFKARASFIMSVSSIKIELPVFKAGSIAEIKVTESGSMDTVYTFDGEIFVEGKKAMKAKLTVMDFNDETLERLTKESDSIE